jgi:hypothetical protein
MRKNCSNPYKKHSKFQANYTGDCESDDYLPRTERSSCNPTTIGFRFAIDERVLLKTELNA